jgi:hypothetical protein
MGGLGQAHTKSVVGHFRYGVRASDERRRYTSHKIHQYHIICIENEEGGCASVDSVGTIKRTINVKLRRNQNDTEYIT